MPHSIDHKLGALVQISQRKLVEILDRISGRKDFIIDSTLLKPLERIIKVAKLRSHGVDKIYKLEKTDTPSTNSQRVFFIPGDLITLKNVSDKINREISKPGNVGTSYHIIFVGRRLRCLTHLLEEEGLYGLVTLHAFQWELIQLDDRILSLEYFDIYKALFLDGDQALLPCVAKSIWTLYLMFGKPNVTLIQGKYSHMVDNMVKLLCGELCSPTQKESSISCFLIVDRDIDYISTLLTGATYTSLLDEVFGIKSGMININGSSDPVSSCLLNSSDEIYSEIRSRHFSDVYSFLSAKTKKLSTEYKKSQNMALQEMKRYISQELQTVAAVKKILAYHIEACEAIINQIGHKFEALMTTEQNILDGRNKKETLSYIEESLATESGNKYGVLRLMALLSLIQDGLYPDEAINMKSQFLHMYGYQHLPCFHNLEKIGLFTEQPSLIGGDSKGNYLASKILPIRKSASINMAQKLKLFPEETTDYELKNPKDMGYVFSGTYIPAVCQIVNMLIKQEISTTEIAKLIPNCDIYPDKPVGQSLHTFLVYIIGGVTYAEISAFQLLEKLTGTKIIVAGTSITNGNLIMKSCF